MPAQYTCRRRCRSRARTCRRRCRYRDRQVAMGYPHVYTHVCVHVYTHTSVQRTRLRFRMRVCARTLSTHRSLPCKGIYRSSASIPYDDSAEDESMAASAVAETNHCDHHATNKRKHERTRFPFRLRGLRSRLRVDMRVWTCVHIGDCPRHSKQKGGRCGARPADICVRASDAHARDVHRYASRLLHRHARRLVPNLARGIGMCAGACIDMRRPSFSWVWTSVQVGEYRGMKRKATLLPPGQRPLALHWPCAA